MNAQKNPWEEIETTKDKKEKGEKKKRWGGGGRERWEEERERNHLWSKEGEIEPNDEGTNGFC